MAIDRLRIAICLSVTSIVLGCHWADRRSTVPQSLLTSRQYAQQGVAAMERDQWSQAESILAQAVKACPTNSEARQHYAEALWRRGARGEALAEIEEASKLAPNDAELHARAAELQLAMGQTETARVRADKAAAIDPKLPAALAARARVAWASGKPREALADYHRALCYAPEDRRLLQETATLYQAMNEPHRALATVQALADTYSIGEEPQSMLAQLGNAYERLGRWDDAAASYAVALQRGQPSPELHFRLATAQARLGRPADAEHSLENALALNPQHQPSRDMLGQILVARQNDETLRR